jgi:hypothetical protein
MVDWFAINQIANRELVMVHSRRMVLASKQSQRRNAVHGTTKLGNHSDVRPRTPVACNPRDHRVVTPLKMVRLFYRLEGEKLWRVNRPAFN